MNAKYIPIVLLLSSACFEPNPAGADRGTEEGSESGSDTSNGAGTDTSVNPTIPSSGGPADTTSDGPSETSELTDSTGALTTGGGSDSTSSADSTTMGGNSAPVATDDVVYAKQGVTENAANILQNDIDPDGDALLVVSSDVDTDAGGNVSVAADGSVSYSPPGEFWGEDGFDYTIEDSEGASSSGRVQVFVAPTYVTIDETFDFPGGFMMEGEAAGDELGISLSRAGDINQDGRSDILVGAPRSGDNGANSGEAYVVYGKPDTATVALSAVSAGDGGFSILGEGVSDTAGSDLSWAGDINGDGSDDLVIGAPLASGLAPFSGRAYVVLGPVGFLSLVAAGNQGFVMNGEGQSSRIGRAVRAAGDVNADGIDDLIVGSSSHNDNAGRTYVVFGKEDTSEVDGDDVHAGIGGFAIDGADGEVSGFSVDGIGDINGDGFSDLVVGAYSADVPHGPNSGLVYVVFGKATTNPVSLSQVAAGVGGFAIVSESEGDRLGNAVGGAGDVNGDGVGDIVVGAQRAGSSNAGRAYVVFGKSGGAPVQLTDVAAGVGGYAILGIPDAQLGVGGVTGVGDVNADGLADIAAVGFGPGYILYGKSDTFPINVADASSGNVGFEIGPDAARVTGAGDVNGDGVDDVLASLYSVEGVGRAYVIFGVPTLPLK